MNISLYDLPRSPREAYITCRLIIKGRWIEAENIIIKDPYYAYWYAVDIINGRLPENMHNMMLLQATIENSAAEFYNDCYWAKEYFDFIK